MYRWHFDNSNTEAIVYGDTEMEARNKLFNLFSGTLANDFELIGVEEMLSLEDKIG